MDNSEHNSEHRTTGTSVRPGTAWHGLVPPMDEVELVTRDQVSHPIVTGFRFLTLLHSNIGFFKSLYIYLGTVIQ